MMGTNRNKMAGEMPHRDVQGDIIWAGDGLRKTADHHVRS